MKRHTRVFQFPAHVVCCALAVMFSAVSGASASAGEDSPQQALSLAVAIGDVDGARRAIAAGADVDARSDLDAPLIFWAARSGSIELVDLLLSHGANADAVDEDGFTALHAAAYWSHAEIVGLLLKHGANANLRSTHGHTPLNKAMERLERDDGDDSPFVPGSDARAVQTVSVLLNGGASASAPDGVGISPILRAARTGSVALVDVLIGAGADIEARGPDDVGPLYVAIMGHHTSVAMRFIERHADVNVITAHGYTALSQAAI